MTNPEETIRTLAAMTDDAAFERLVMAVLRQHKREYEALIHTGVNTDGKTIKAPLDGIAFVPGAHPPRMIAAHHTTCAPADLRKKWLHDPATVTPRKGGQPTAPAGDLLKTAEVVQEERTRTPVLEAALVLTTNREPPEDLVRDVTAAGQARGIDIDIWSVTRIADFLDNKPEGQWLRREHLGIEQERLSCDLLAKLSRDSMAAHRPYDRPEAWVARSLDRKIAESKGNLLFVVAESGLGKSVACYKQLARHVEAGGFGLAMPHEILASAQTIEQAIDASLRQLHPQLVFNAAADVRQLCSSGRRLLLVVEDINRSGQAQALLEKVARWADFAKEEQKTDAFWRLLCPVWPQIIASLGDESRKRIQTVTVIGEAFSATEGCEAVQKRSQVAGRILSDLDADAISRALGHDPLLIALHDPKQTLQPGAVVQRYINVSVERATEKHQEYPAAEYHLALRALASVMLARRQLDPPWSEVVNWFAGHPDTATMLRHLTLEREVLRLDSSASDGRLAFRHDRVRDSLLASAIAEMARRDVIGDEVFAEPYFAEVIGAALLHEGIPLSFVERVGAVNPLVLFYAFRIFREPTADIHNAVLSFINRLLDNPETHDHAHGQMRWAALAALAEIESTRVLNLVQKFHERGWSVWEARFRNGDVGGGLELCLHLQPGVGAPWRDRQIEHAKTRFGANLRSAIDQLIRKPDLDEHSRIAALRLAGYLADPNLAEGIEAAWNADDKKVSHLADYLWAAARCCGNNPERFLAPVCDAWAALPDPQDEKAAPSPRVSLGADHIRWAFQKDVPVSAIPYFVKRGRQDELRWPITYMLHSIDHPDAVEFVARELAAIQRRVEGKGGFSPFASFATDTWRRRQEDEQGPMSPASRERLLALWQNESGERHLREQAFRLWAASDEDGDLEILRSVGLADPLTDNVLWERLRRKDRTATPGLIAKLHGEYRAAWWRLAREVWSEDLERVFDEELALRRQSVARQWHTSYETDYELQEIITELPTEKAEAILVKHWDHLHFQALFVQAALYAATPRTRELAREAIIACLDADKLFQHLTSHYGIRTVGRTGITRPIQIEALIPYLGRLSDLDIYLLWDVCNDHGWFHLRKQYLDRVLNPKYGRGYTDETRVMASLDKMVADNHAYWIDRWIDDFVKTGASLNDIMNIIDRWLSDRKSLGAFELAASAIIQAGRRKDLEMLNVDIEPRDRAAAIRSNTEFAVRRRTLH